ncbi:MAG: GDSL-type esterase/lipase family protein, partial [Phenylobacterium sp.]
FGHNDANREKPERYAPVVDYKAYLRRYIEVARRAGGRAVLLTPVTRRNFVEGRIAPSFAEYSQGVREVAAETGTPLIDLDALSARVVERAGVEGSKAYFLHYPVGAGLPGFPGGIDDDTHFSELGARRMADVVAGGLARLSLPVSSHVLAERAALTATSSVGNASCTAPADQPPRRYRFAGKAQPGETMVAPGRRYHGGYGFESGSPRIFSVAAPPGNYRVTVTLGGAPASATTIEAETRRLMLQDVRTARGQTVQRSFVVNVRDASLAPPPPNGPGGAEVRLHPQERGGFTWDDRLTLELLGPAPAMQAVMIEPAEATTVFLFGDSTVTDQRREPYASWGQMLPRFLGPDVAVANYAESGETLKSFIAELRLDKALSVMRPGDYALIQFGHNDQKAQWPQTYAAAGSTFRAYLRAFIAEVRLRGATPVLVTPPERRTFTADGRIRPTLSDYAQAMRAVAVEEKVKLIDLNAVSIRLYQALGPEAAALAFADGGRDLTH